MKRRFALPVVIALSVEAVLLLGFNRPGVASAQTPPRLITVKDPLPLTDPDPAVPAQESASAEPAPARPAPPSIPEPPVVPRPDEITQAASPSTPPNEITMDRIPPGIDGPSVGHGTGVDGIIPSEMLDNAPRVRFPKAPQYPYEASRDQRSGEVLVEFSVDETGRVFNPSVVRSSDPIFEEPTLKAVRQWRFEPGRRNGRAVRFRMRLPVEFHPDGD